MYKTDCNKKKPNECFLPKNIVFCTKSKVNDHYRFSGFKMKQKPANRETLNFLLCFSTLFSQWFRKQS